MGAKTKIQWADASWGPLRAQVKHNAGDIAQQKGYTSLVQVATKMQGHIGPHCERCSPGCGDSTGGGCYSEANNSRCLPSNGTGLPFDRRARDLVNIMLDENILVQPLGWRRPRRIFVCSQTDLFAEFVTDEMIDRVMAIAAMCPQHTFLFLTKRADRLPVYYRNAVDRRDAIASALNDRRIFQKPWKGLPSPWGVAEGIWKGWRSLCFENMRLGCSVENQEYADKRRVPMQKMAEYGFPTFVSYEPALGPVDWSGWEFLKQLIVGGESGTEARSFEVQWARDAVAWCREHSVAPFVKQLGARPLLPIADSKKAIVVKRAAGLDWPEGTRFGKPNGHGIRLKDRKGGEMLEWPADLRVREM